jgi:Zn-dependent metalloprotease
MSQRRCLHCILPPYLLERIATSGDERQRRWAIDTLAFDHTLRAARLAHSIAASQVAAPPYVDVMREAGRGVKRRTIFDCHGAEELRQARIARGEGAEATGDAAVDEAYDGLGATYDFYYEAYERDSVDNRGMPLNGYVHYGQDYDNAFWDGSQMVFGDGDGTLFNRFTIAIDVIGHELTHGVTGSEANLQYFGQSGALNESCSDVGGVCVKQFQNDETAEEADWLIGEGLLAPDVQGRALRDMLHPGTAYDDDVLGKDPQPAHMDDFVRTTKDNGGVHINSGIPNRAFATLARALGGRSWEKAGVIWYRTIRDPRLRPNAQFRSFARATMRSARELYGGGADEVAAVHDAWQTVGVTVQR